MRFKDDMVAFADLKHFTHFVDYKDGSGAYHDYTTLEAAQRAHQAAIAGGYPEHPNGTIRSRIRGYTADRMLAKTVSDWRGSNAQARA